MTEQNPRRILVSGGRDFDEKEVIFSWLDKAFSFGGVEVIIEGGCPTGADKIAREWAYRNSVPCYTYHANWNLHEKKAGPVRNGYMLSHSKPTHVLGFAGNKGTADMIKKARKAGVETHTYGENPFL